MIDDKSLLVKLLLWIGTLHCWRQAKTNRRGRPFVYPWHSIFCGLLFMILKHLRRVSALDRALRQSKRYQWLCGFENQLPSQRTWYRRLQKIQEIVVLLKENLLIHIFKKDTKVQRIAVIDGSGLCSYGRHVSKHADPKKYTPGDSDATWGKTVTKGWFQGYKLHCISTSKPKNVPLAWDVAEASSQEANYVGSLLDQARQIDYTPRYLAADKAYDSEALFQEAKGHKTFLAAILRNIPPPKPGSKKATTSRPLRQKWSKSPFGRSVIKRRSDIERLFGHTKDTFLMDPLPVRHWPNVRAYVDLCFLGYLSLVAFNVAHQRPAQKLQDIMCSF